MSSDHQTIWPALAMHKPLLWISVVDPTRGLSQEVLQTDHLIVHMCIWFPVPGVIWNSKCLPRCGSVKPTWIILSFALSCQEWWTLFKHALEIYAPGDTDDSSWVVVLGAVNADSVFAARIMDLTELGLGWMKTLYCVIFFCISDWWHVK